MHVKDYKSIITIDSLNYMLVYDVFQKYCDHLYILVVQMCDEIQCSQMTTSSTIKDHRIERENRGVK